GGGGRGGVGASAARGVDVPGAPLRPMGGGAVAPVPAPPDTAAAQPLGERQPADPGTDHDDLQPHRRPPRGTFPSRQEYFGHGTIRMSNENPQEELIGAVMRAVAAFQDSTDRVDEAAAQRLGLNRTDLRCLGVLCRAGATTAGQLAAAARLSPGATPTPGHRLAPPRPPPRA